MFGNLVKRPRPETGEPLRSIIFKYDSPLAYWRNIGIDLQFGYSIPLVNVEYMAL